MTFVQEIILFIIIYLCIYALISRVCQCIEHCSTARAYSKCREIVGAVSMGELKKEIENVEPKTDKE